MKKVEKFCLELTLTLSFGRKYLYFVNMSYSIGDVVKKTGLSAYTLRYYEKEGLLPFVKKKTGKIIQDIAVICQYFLCLFQLDFLYSLQVRLSKEL